MAVIGLDEMQPGQTGIVKRLSGGPGFVRRLQSMGIREGKAVKKISNQFWRGPVTIEIDSRQFSIGRGMSTKIRVEVAEV